MQMIGLPDLRQAQIILGRFAFFRRVLGLAGVFTTVCRQGRLPGQQSAGEG
jgi:hypothetical protein